MLTTGFLEYTHVSVKLLIGKISNLIRRVLSLLFVLDISPFFSGIILGSKIQFALVLASSAAVPKLAKCRRTPRQMPSAHPAIKLILKVPLNFLPLFRPPLLLLQPAPPQHSFLIPQPTFQPLSIPRGCPQLPNLERRRSVSRICGHHVEKVRHSVR